MRQLLWACLVTIGLSCGSTERASAQVVVYYQSRPSIYYGPPAYGYYPRVYSGPLYSRVYTPRYSYRHRYVAPYPRQRYSVGLGRASVYFDAYGRRHYYYR